MQCAGVVFDLTLYRMSGNKEIILWPMICLPCLSRCMLQVSKGNGTGLNLIHSDNFTAIGKKLYFYIAQSACLSIGSIMGTQG